MPTLSPLQNRCALGCYSPQNNFFVKQTELLLDFTVVHFSSICWSSEHFLWTYYVWRNATWFVSSNQRNWLFFHLHQLLPLGNLSVCCFCCLFDFSQMSFPMGSVIWNCQGSALSRKDWSSLNSCDETAADCPQRPGVLLQAYNPQYSSRPQVQGQV